MSWTEEQRAAAIAELRDDPEGRGYAEMTDEEVAADMALRIWQRPPATVDVTAGSVAACLPLAEFTAWRTSAIPDVVTSWAIFSAILSSNGTIRGDRLLEQAAAFGPVGLQIFSADSVAAVAALIPMVSRAELLGLWAIKPGHVAEIRRDI
jgi:hypothetical protein